MLRLLDLTQSKKWVSLRRKQKKLCNSEFPETNSARYSRQSAHSHLSKISNMTGFSEVRIPRTFSQPQAPLTRNHIQPRLVKSAGCCTVTQRQGNAVKGLKRASFPCSSRERRDRSALESQQSGVGVGVFLSLDFMEKGQCAVSL